MGRRTVRGRTSVALLTSLLMGAYMFLSGAVPAFAQVLAIELAPPEATNAAGTAHMVTATVTDGIDPVADVDVHFDVAGDGEPNPDSGDATTDVNGEATFSFTNEVAGSTNTITACIDSNESAGCDTGASFVGANSAAASSVAIPAHQAGDLLLIFAYRDNNNAAPTAPAGWTTIGSAGNNGQSEHTAYKIAASSSEVSGTWTNATHIAVLVYRNVDAVPIGNTAAASDNNASTVTYPALTLQAPGTSWVAGLAGHRLATNMNIAPTGMVNRTGGVMVGAHDTDGGVAAWPATNVTYNQSAAYRSRTVEIRATPIEASDTATKTWVAGAAVNIALEPAEDINDVGTDHDVTATVTDEFGNPVEGEAVHFDVTGDGTPVPATGDGTTDAAGQATFTFTNETAGTNTITGCIDADDSLACEVAEASDTATKTWVAGAAVNIALEPAEDINDVGTDHDVTATVTDEFGNPVVGEAVHFDVTGDGTPVPATGDGTTDAAGQATFTFTNETAGTNTITGCIDADDSLACEVAEASDTATKTWEPVATDISLAPASATNVVGSMHTVIATVTDQSSEPFGGADVHFAVSSQGTPTPAAGDDTTDATGEATFTFSNNAAVTNTITACIDANDNQACDVGEASDTATKTWQPAAPIPSPVPTTCPGFENDPRNQVVGTSGNDTLVGTSGADIICGLEGDDDISGLGGADLILAGPGSDLARGGPGNDTLVGDIGSDTLVGGSGKDVLRGDADNDVLRGGADNDRLRGGPGRDTLRGGGGNDRMNAGPGRDTLRGGGGNDRMNAGPGRDTLRGGGGNDRLNGGPGSDSCRGGGGVNTIRNCER